jgi:hypothetical protein
MTGARRGTNVSPPLETGGRTAPAAGRLYAGYLVAQAIAGVALWIAFAESPTIRSWFELMPEKHAVMDAFVFADLFLIVAGSGLGAWAIERGSRFAAPVIAFTAGGIVYPTLYLLGWVSFTGTGVACLGIMVPSATFTCWVAYQVSKLRR